LKSALAWWGLAMGLCASIAQAAPRVGAEAAAPVPAGGAAVGPAPSTTPGPAPAGGAGAAPDPGEVPDYALPPPAVVAPRGEAAPSRAELELSEELEAARRRRERRRQLWLDEDEERERDARLRRRRIRRDLAVTAAEGPEPWQLVAPHFLVGVERITNWLAWDESETFQLSPQSGGGTKNAETLSSGTDVSFLGSGAPSRNVFGVPRLAFDGMFASGFTLGGSLSYMTVSGKTQAPTGTGGQLVRDDPTSSIFVLAARAGVVLPASKLVGIWLRGGFSRISRSTDFKIADPGVGITTTIVTTSTLVNVTLDPQLIINPFPHVGITFGALLDIPLGGSVESTSFAATHDLTASSYGATSGLLAIF